MFEFNVVMLEIQHSLSVSESRTNTPVTWSSKVLRFSVLCHMAVLSEYNYMRHCLPCLAFTALHLAAFHV
jgi:hypothetical protein